MTVVVTRAGARIRSRVRVVERPGDPGEVVSKLAAAARPIERLGVLAADLDPAVAARMPWLRDRSGVLVAAWSADAPASLSGLQPGDVIRALNGEPLTTLDAIASRLGAMEIGAPAVLTVDRLGRRLFLAFEIE